MKKIKSSLFQMAVAYYVCASLVGCTTASWRQAESYANRESKYWTIGNVTFAAIRDQRFVRLCATIQHFSEEATTELEIDLRQVMEQLHNEATVTNSIEDGAKLEKGYAYDKEADIYHIEGYVACDTELKKDEEILPIIVKKTVSLNMSATMLGISDEPTDRPSLIVVEHGGARYIVFSAPASMYPNLSNHAFSCYAEDQKESGWYLLVPLAFVGDVIAVMTTVFAVGVCIALLPICIIAMSEKKGPGNSLWPNNMGFFYPLPSRTSKPECN